MTTIALTTRDARALLTSLATVAIASSLNEPAMGRKERVPYDRLTSLATVAFGFDLSSHPGWGERNPER